MPIFVAFLRGINVSGQKKIKMAELRQLLEDSGFLNVKSYLQSGNVVFEFEGVATEIIEGKIKDAIVGSFRLEVEVLVKTLSQLTEIVKNWPFEEEEEQGLTKNYFVLLHTIPNLGLAQELTGKSFPNEQFLMTDQYIYLKCHNGYGRAKCNNNFFERQLKVIATTRNFTTMERVLALAE
ncbi:DUF1697 domain-containing protein [Arenibacter sp. 6A1]|uniref:DUF1697 domain-containing protein n=1 Tax=Arenibacter sp. 6A1 TaxID=2720391 RepID=UPI0014472223|nr:DUF1697 domain-containing protein [Arenibacter sp. 6A1]NKI26105.1 DUF1697 domain-containing protein [Arenibacter sp. 6A1]